MSEQDQAEFVHGGRSSQRRSGWRVESTTSGTWRWHAWCGVNRRGGVALTHGYAVERAQAAERELTGAV